MLVNDGKWRQVIDLAIQAGQTALRLREDGLDIQIKSDGSKVTNADITLDEMITKGLSSITPDTQIISEENIPENPDSAYETAWVVDPIDGTNAFADPEKKRKNFGVLIGLVENHVPVAGIAYYPAHNLMYYTQGDRAYKCSVNVGADGEVTKGIPQELRTRPSTSDTLQYQQFKTNVITEKVRGNAELRNYNQPNSFLAVLEGKLDAAAYLDSMGDWDLAAPDAIIRKANGAVVSAETGDLMQYGLTRTPDRAYKQDTSIAGNLETLERVGLANKGISKVDLIAK